MAENKLILYADDDIDDRTWFSEACQTVSLPWQLHFLETGKQVIDYLVQKQEPLPSLIMLDLNMPGMDGRQTLKELKDHQVFQQIPVVMVTTSINRIDKEVCRRLGAALLITKPNTLNEWRRMVKELQTYIR